MKNLWCLFGILFLLLPLDCRAENVQTVEWSDLIPKQYRNNDPLANLPQEEADEVEWIIYLRQNLPEKITEREQEFYDEMVAALPRLKEKGIDVDQIIADRNVRENSLNTELDGKYIRLAGYLLPLDLSGQEIREFLLVPYVGACIHVPPPPKNQIVYARMVKPLKYNLNDLFRPVWVVGKLSAQSLSKELYLGDGSADIDIGYALLVDVTEEYKVR